MKATSQKEKETIKEYAQRWRELAAQIVPPLGEKEVTKIFLKSLSSFYYERMITSAPSNFTEMVNMGMRLEEGVREGRQANDEGSSAKRYGVFAKKKKGEAHVVSSHVKRRPSVKRKSVRPASNQHQVAHIAPAFRETQHYQHQHQQQQHQQYQQQQHHSQQQAYQPRNNNSIDTSYERKRVTFDPIPMTYAELYPSLIERKLITPCHPLAVPTNPQWWYKPELHCVYHSGAPEHDVENCYPLKTKVQDLIRSGILFFKDVGPNVKKNPLPEHGKSAVNMVQGCPGSMTMTDVLCALSKRDIQEMLDHGVIEILLNRDEDEVNVISPVFRIPEPVIVRYDGSMKKVSPTLIIKPAGPVPYSSDRVVPYRYNTVALEEWKEVLLPSTSVTSISDVSGMSRSGRVFSAPPKPHVDISRRTDVVDNSASPPHHEALQRLLDVAYVDHDVTIEQFDSIVANITACKNMSFYDVDLPEEGKDHNLALHISMNCKDDALSNVLVDTGSSLNM
ncbi:hypothetical protein KIW84_020958 [Lathyrus oleraceus]|uniref:Retrotransposon gag domain-containing protein n=1 Tax=Pisum sativum TaxID=3888 RepID=A0A9D4Y6I7_PEA|nr:hypothetical protein KIW84_020958 [Pisum sativum]